jgi:hypothetical protein
MPLLQPRATMAAAAAVSCCWCFEATSEPHVVRMRAPPGMRDEPMKMNICAKCQVVALPLLADKIPDIENVYEFAPDFIVVYRRAVLKFREEITYLLSDICSMLRGTDEEANSGLEPMFSGMMMTPCTSSTDAESS